MKTLLIVLMAAILGGSLASCKKAPVNKSTQAAMPASENGKPINHMPENLRSAIQANGGR